MGNELTNNANNNTNTNAKPQVSIDVNAETIPSASSYHKLQKSQSSRTSMSFMSIQADNLCTPQPRLSARLSSRPLSSDEDSPSPSPSVDTVESLPSIPTRHQRQNARRLSSFAHVMNGITGTHISSRIVKIAAKFWQKNIETLPMKEKLEIGCAILFDASAANKDMRQILMKNNKNIEQKSLKFLDMMGWLIRYLITDNIDLYSILTRLGVFHQRMGVKIDHFGTMLQAMHDTFSFYFPLKYNIEVKYAIDEIFTLAAQIMTGEELTGSSQLNAITNEFGNGDIPFLKNLGVCIQSTVGREYLNKYLQQTWCDEIAMFLQAITKFKTQLTPVQRFMIARDIIKTSINPSANFTLNISYDCRMNTLKAMEELESQFSAKKQLNIDSDFFDQVEHEMHKLILDNHWVQFKKNIKALQCKSFGL